MRKCMMTSFNVDRLCAETIERMRKKPDSIPIAFYEKRFPEKMLLSVVHPETSFFGWFIRVPDEFDDEDRVPADLLALLKEASESGFEWIMLDEEENSDCSDSPDENTAFVLVSQNFDSGKFETKIFSTEAAALSVMTDEVEKACADTDFAEGFDEIRRKVLENGETVHVETEDPILSRDELFVSEGGACLTLDGVIEAQWDVSETPLPKGIGNLRLKR